MKLTREQVAQLSDLELNRGMIWCYPTDGRVWNDGFFHYCSLKGALNYLTDYNLTIPLACDNGLSVDMSELRFTHVHSAYEYSRRKNPLRAICEVLLMIAMERE